MIVAMASWIFIMRILASFGSATVAGATIALRVMMCTMMPAWGLSKAFNGSGDTMTPTKINIFFFWILQIPLAYLLSTYTDFGYEGVFWAMFGTETSVGLFTLWLFTRGKWKLTKV